MSLLASALPENLLESELFGYVEGAFTGARKNGKPGLFEYAHRGTIFLDEIEDMSPMLQVKLLRVLQEKEVMRVGGSQLINVDVRIIAATNENLEHLVESGQFRKDLYYRLNTMQLNIPPLRERKSDIPLLLEHFMKLEHFSFKFSEEVMEHFLRHEWEGNVRELRNYVEYLQCVNQPMIHVKDLPPQLTAATASETPAAHIWTEKNGGTELSEDELFILECLYDTRHQKIHAGRRLLCEMAQQEDRDLSEQMIRRILKNLEEKGLVTVSRGRAGSRLTQSGLHYFEKE